MVTRSSFLVGHLPLILVGLISSGDDIKSKQTTLNRTTSVEDDFLSSLYETI